MSDPATDAELHALIPDSDWLADHENGAEIWIGATGNYQLAIGYSLIFWPRFVVIDDYVLRYGTTESGLRAWEASLDDPGAIEAMLNHVHIGDIHTSEEGSEAQFRYLGRALKAIHETKLKADFPERKFVAEFNDEPGLDLIDYQLTFWQVRD